MRYKKRFKVKTLNPISLLFYFSIGFFIALLIFPVMLPFILVKGEYKKIKH